MTPDWIIHCDDEPGRRTVGGKAAALRALSTFDVPPWFVVAPDDEGAIDEDSTRAAIDAALARLGGDAFAVRSSAAAEDGAEHSFAGQFESYLHVPASEVFDRVRDVRASATTGRSQVYRSERGLEGDEVRMAVLVQRMIEPDIAGVAFAVDPVTGDDVVVISAVAGTADRLVSGEVTGDLTHVDHDDLVTRPGATGTIVTDPDARRIARLARDVSSARGAPQDIEWAIDGDGLYLLQARPVTTVTADGTLNIWDNSNIAESYSGVTTPLTFSFARKAYEQVYITFCRLMGVPERVLHENSEMFRHMLGLLGGRVYYNLINWYRLIAMLPGYRVNASFMEQMMGVESALPPDARRLLREEAAARSGGRLIDALRLVRSLAALAIRHVTLDRRVRAFEPELVAQLRPVDELEHLPATELVTHYRDLERSLLGRWDAPILNDFFAMIYIGLLRKQCERLADSEGESLHNHLLADVGDIISTEPARLIQEIATLVRDATASDPDLIPTLAETPGAEALAFVTRHPTIHARVESYIAAFGDRCLQELKLESATLRDDPAPLLRSIAAMASRPPRTVDPATAATAADTRERLRGILRGHPVAALKMRFILPRARARLRDRENLRFLRTVVFGYVRRIFVALGHRYRDSDLVDDPRDIFFLDVEEALGLATGVATTTDVRSLVALRRATYEAQCAAAALPSRFETRGAVHPLRPIVRPSASPDIDESDPTVRRGVGCCPGVVRGRARVVTDPIGIRLDPGDIVIAERTDPGWVMLFPAASAIAVAHGSILSHTSIVARELGVPCVVAVPGLLDWVIDGEQLELDGAAGVLRKLEPTP